MSTTGSAPLRTGDETSIAPRSQGVYEELLGPLTGSLGGNLRCLRRSAQAGRGYPPLWRRRLEWYMARSARRSRPEARSTRSQVATPTEAETPSGSASIRRLAACSPPNSADPGASRPNSSPPSRAMRSPPPRVVVCHERATARRTWSPAWWPWASLIALKLSRSTTTTDSADPLRAERSRNCIG